MNFYILFVAVTIILSLFYVEVSANNNDEIIVLEQLTMEKINNEEYQEALGYVDQILNIEPENVNALNNKGGIFIEMKLYEKAVKNFDRVLILDGNNTQALNNKGIALIKQKKIVESFDTLYRSLKIDPTNKIAFENTEKIVKDMTWVDETKNGFSVVTIRDNQGKLVDYKRGDEIKVHLPLGYKLLQDFGELKEISFNGENRTLAVLKNTNELNRNQFIGIVDGRFQFGERALPVIEVSLNGFIGKEGDIVTNEISVILPQ